MKTSLSVLIALILLRGSAYTQQLTIHEWGTFTTLHGSAGGSLSGLYFEEEQLPPFVYHFPGFSPDSTLTWNGYKPCRDVTVKMETPVLYFYSSTEQAVQVHVDFPMGVISQWYPNRSGGEVMPPKDGDTLDFDKSERAGSIDWKATVLDPMTKEQLTQTQNIPPKWDAPRQTDANLVKNEEGEVEKYLFYRGVANFPPPISVGFNRDGSLSVKNTSQFDFPFIYIYDHQNSTTAGIWGIGPLASYETRVFTKPQNYSSFVGDSAYTQFRIALQNAGLNEKEAQAMLNTWSDGYFLSPGFKIFWIVPRTLTDRILPISISPRPDKLERVLVAKSEILTPDFEEQLLSYYKANGNLDQWKNDRYHLAYMQRVQQLLAKESIPPSSANGEITITPNPATTMIHINGISGTSPVTIYNVLGEKVMSSVQNGTFTSSELDIHALQAGTYFIILTDENHRATLKLLKR
jgi:hypothetical protein